MKVCIAGSRNFVDYDCLCKLIKNIFKEKQITIISGNAQGADILGELFAKENKLNLEIYPANWSMHGKAAGYIRNTKMANISDCLIAFWDGKSKGTKNTINNMKRLNKPVLIYNYITNSYEI